MARKRTIEYTAFDVEILDENVTTESYIELFKYIKKKENRRDIPVRNTYLTINTLGWLSDDKPEDGFIGKIMKWDGITSDWYNEETGQKADLKDLKAVQIPDNLKANPKFFNFVFYPKARKIICEISEQDNEISENILLEFFRFLFGTDKINEKFKRVETRLINDSDTIEDVLSNDKLLMVHIVIKRPDSDNLSAEEKILLEQMQKQNIYSYSKIIESKKREFLTLTDDIKEEIRLTENYGYIDYKAEGSDGILIHRSTSESAAYIRKEQYNPDENQAYYVIKYVGLEIVDELK